MKFKKLSFKKVQKLKTATKKSKREKNSSVNEQALRKAFADCSDVVFSSLKFQQHVVDCQH
ncbi:hypothetical protein [Pseudobacillus badius]|uniref:hypothetical protein n=1 Tax=Bacillus badius TaxID=1455 RepID=UPI0007B0545C|nr:hypothetical protein [Bacillus badius]KZN99322.1 hypothetical protein A4244_19045 [Bacillus badius]OCS84849.1 hypothetical protein A6M11_19060 [Bacillus badius]OVE46211.1 hypothetical protein B1A98_19685 [Bacillus badius]TDV97880.1 hypothetical protein B0G66_1358 [Bacillus badius]